MWAKASVALVCVLVTSAAHAQDGTTYNLAGHDTRDIVITTGFTATWLLAETAFKQPLAPQSCHWCRGNGFDAWARDGLKWDESKTAAQLSDVGLVVATLNGFGALAFAAVMDHAGTDFTHNSLYLLQSVSVAMTLTNVVKVLVARERPAIHYNSDFASHVSESEQNLSFFSGHSAFTFAFATGAGTLASLRGYRHARWVWASGLAIAAFTAYARIGADAHYTTDVLIGGAVGASVGSALPLWLHARTTARATETPAAVVWQPVLLPTPYEGAVVGVSGLF